MLATIFIVLPTFSKIGHQHLRLVTNTNRLQHPLPIFNSSCLSWSSKIITYVEWSYVELDFSISIDRYIFIVKLYKINISPLLKLHRDIFHENHDSKFFIPADP